MLWHLFHCPQVPSTGSSSLSPTGTHSERMHHSPSPHGVPSAHGMCWVLHLIQYKYGIGNTAKKINDICRIYSNNLCFFKVNCYWIQRHFTVVFRGFAPLYKKVCPMCEYLQPCSSPWVVEHQRRLQGGMYEQMVEPFSHTPVTVSPVLCNWVLGVILRRPEAKS